MGLSVLTASSTTSLITLALVKARLGITNSSQDASLTALIKGASSAFVRYLGRDLARQRYLETVGGTNRSLLYLSRFPVDVDSLTATIDGAAVTDFSVEVRQLGQLYRELGWASNWNRSNHGFTYKAGYVLPDQISDWATLLAVVLGHWVRPTVTAVAPPLMMECTTAGTMAATEPVWPTTAGGTVVSGTATFTARDAEELPSHLQELAYREVFVRLARMNRAAGLASMAGDQFSESYFATGIDKDISAEVASGLDLWRVAE